MTNNKKIKLITADSSLTNSRRVINENFEILWDTFNEFKQLYGLSTIQFPKSSSKGDRFVLEGTGTGTFSVVKDNSIVGTQWKFEGKQLVIPQNHQYIVTKLQLLNGSSVITEPGGELIVLENEIPRMLSTLKFPELRTGAKTMVDAINEIVGGVIKTDNNNVKGSNFE